MWWCEQCECCSWILKKSNKWQIRQYHLWLSGLKNLKVIQENQLYITKIVCRISPEVNMPVQQICEIVIIMLLSNLFVGRHSNFKITASMWGSIYIYSILQRPVHTSNETSFPSVTLVIHFVGSIKGVHCIISGNSLCGCFLIHTSKKAG